MLVTHEKQPSSQTLAVLQIDGLWLAFPQYQIASIHLVSDMDTRISKGANVGFIQKNNQDWPIYAMSGSLLMLPSLSKQHRFCVCFHPGAAQNYIGLAVDAVVALELQDSQILQPLPDCMQNSRSPFTQVVRSENRLIFMSDIGYLKHYVECEENN